LQVFGPIGSIVGAGVAIFAAFAVVMEKTSGLAKNLGDATDGMAEAMKRQFETSRAAIVPLQELEAQYGKNADAVRDLLDAQVALASMDMAKAQASLVSSMNSEMAQIGRLSDLMALPFQNMPTLQRDIANLTASIGANLNMSAKEAVALSDAMERLAGARGAQAIFDAAGGVASALEAARNEAGLLPSELDAAYRAALELQDSARMTGLELQSAVDAGTALNSTNMSDGLNAALSVAQKLALATREALFPSAGKRGDPRSFENDPYWKNKAFPSAEKMLNMRESSATARGGAGSIDPLQKLKEQLDLEAQLIGKTEAQRRIIQALGADYQNYDASVIESLALQINGMEELNRVAAQQREIASSIRSAF
jgi:hypothetical protein